MRMLDRNHIDYKVNNYPVTEAHMDGTRVAQLVGVSVDEVFKTLVLENAQHEHFVFIIPVNATLNMKLAAKSVKEKKLHLMPLDDLKRVTGYVRGGCSPIGMKKLFPTIIDSQSERLDAVYVSGGERGTQIQIKVTDLITQTKAQVTSIIES
ncbi:Cys-tRNA(Pro) deacylase [Staphylococcus gallinarum]|uniref:Cys-tRNA(Pro)/Cys-tRNA(Cys) deacylase n=1 Tax=Staphylococcus gallinarum TaxID=1293 RepID=A0A2T4SWY1_STAGA|nr:Cys-tRNA(Pro) deacylase [Staphylococcus gallinarum]MCD8821647.1 Cys-tRNA(Pro) deacylase [Staphylococcus gallinarum]PTL06282.1 Cys-tRNA(Pro) deacylase [Staphylococcus gallinarum]PTL09393.1 Cys-tRNA(Pro) deacylase [Staphylococcus gallinarum]RIL24976.1 Cys-tRNA(Pro) deacylase [Staphylococcus gallinarum]RIL25775.1 Cys-tRNA(Pro) deacylase [Staphylococcus gallinarum]